MSIIEAKEDGIEYSNGWYKIPCEACGKGIVKRTAYSRKRSYVCDNCKAIERGKSDVAALDKKEAKFRTAVNRIESCVGNIDEYKNAIAVVHRTLHRTGWYRSTEEIMAAIELLHHGIRTIHQQKIGKYHADFVLPDYKVLLEIDGKPYHNRDTLEREGLRDGTILLMMGVDWEIVRIDTANLNRDIRQLVPAIEAVLEHRRKERKNL